MFPPRFAGKLVGRQRELARVDERLARDRVAWLVGMGGVGKSRLAAEVCLERGGRWVDAAAVEDGEGLGAAIGRAIGFRAREVITARRLAAWMQERRVPLLVLDDVDRARDEARDWVKALREAAPVVVTSRGVPPDLESEPIEPLPPDEGQALFLARVAEPAEIPRDLERLGHLVRSLGSLPLAIELAAARLQVLDLASIADGVDRSLAFLRAPLADGRQASIEATLRWSWDQLGPAEQRCLTRCSVFAASFDLASLGGGDPLELLDPLHALVQLHLVAHVGGDPPRFRLHPLIRRFAVERLDASERDRLLREHAAMFGARAAAMAEDMRGAAQVPARARLAADHDEYAAVLERAAAGLVAVVDGQRAARLLAAGSSGAHAQSWAARGLALPLDGEGPQTRIAAGLLHLWFARAWFASGRLAEVEAELDAAEALSIDPARTETMRLALAIQRQPGEPGARARLDRAIEDPRRDPGELAELLYVRAIFVHGPDGALDLALADKLRSAEIAPDPVQAASGWISAATTALTAGRLAEARVWIERADELARVGPSGLARLVRARRMALRYLEGDRVGALTAAEALFVEFDAEGSRSDAGYYRVIAASIRLGLGLPLGNLLEQVPDDAFLETWWEARLSRAVALALARIRGGEEPPEVPLVTLHAHSTERSHQARRAVEKLWAARGAAERAEIDSVHLAEARAELAGWERVSFATLLDAVEAVARSVEQRAAAWRIAADGAGFRAPGGPWVSLERRPTLARLLDVLSDGREHDLASLGDAVWPGERMAPESLRNRLHVAVSTLRKLGLDPLETTPRGWRIRTD